jgi:thiol-disulfide isomerase/thioredoxin
MDGSGQRIRLDRPLGVPSVIALWASWCSPCAEELPVFQRLHEDAAGQLLVLGVSTRDDAERAVGAAVDLHLGFPSVYDPQGETLRVLRRTALPVTALVGADGRVLHVYNGVALTDGTVRALVRQYLRVGVR